jgi:hypothetical protein
MRKVTTAQSLATVSTDVTTLMGPQPVFEPAFLLQGLLNNTLVAGKTTALRMFTIPATLENVMRVRVDITSPDGSKERLTWTRSLGPTGQGPDGEEPPLVRDPGRGWLPPSVVCIIVGRHFPVAGDYSLVATLFDNQFKKLDRYKIQSTLAVTRDLRAIVSLLWSGHPLRFEELQAAHEALMRFSYLWPIRDGLSPLDGTLTAGLRYDMDFDPYYRDQHLGPLFARYNRRARQASGRDWADFGVTYRFPNVNEGSGAYSGGSQDDIDYSIIVWGAPIATSFCHETGHIFGLEPSGDPHSDPNDPQHSKDLTIDPGDAALGWDVQFNRPFPLPTYDIMYSAGPDPEYPDPQHSFSSWDWDYLLQQIQRLNSTGP